MKNLFVFIAILTLSVSLSDKEILQQAFNGLFSANGLANPTTVVECFDDDSAHKTVVFIGDVLDKAARGSLSDLLALKDTIEKFGNELPQSVKDCLNKNEELKTLAKKYGIDESTDPNVIVKKVITYVTLHYLEVHGELGKLDNDWKAGNYQQVGQEAGNYGHKILNAQVELTDKEILQELLNCAFEENKLPDPTTIVPCFDDDSAHKTVVFIGELLDKAAHGSVQDLINLKDLVQKFSDSLPQSVKDCLNGNEEVKNLGKKYGIDDTTDPSKIEKEVIEYLTLHYLTVHGWLGQWDKDWKGGKYCEVGHEIADDAHKVLKMPHRFGKLGYKLSQELHSMKEKTLKKMHLIKDILLE